MSALPADADPAAEAEAVHRGDDGDLAVVDGARRFQHPRFTSISDSVGRVGGELLDVDPGLEAPSSVVGEMITRTSGS